MARRSREELRNWIGGTLFRIREMLCGNGNPGGSPDMQLLDHTNADIRASCRDVMGCAPRSQLLDGSSRQKLIGTCAGIRDAIREKRPLPREAKSSLDAVDAELTEAVETRAGLTDTERAILEALDGKALALKQLAGHSQEGGTGKSESAVIRALGRLKKRGEVCNKRGLGYYRPDKPPPRP